MIKTPNRRKKPRRQKQRRPIERRDREQRLKDRREVPRSSDQEAQSDRRKKSRREVKATPPPRRQFVRRVEDMYEHPGKDVFALLRRAQAGHAPSKNRLNRQFLEMVMKTVWEFAKNQRQFDELLSEAVIVFAKAIGTFEHIPATGDDDLSGRFKNSALKSVRFRLEEIKKKRQSVVVTGRGKKIKKAVDHALAAPNGRELAAKGSDPLAFLFKAGEDQQLATVIELLEQLDPRERLVITRHLLEEPAQRLVDIAKDLGIGETMVGKLYHRGLKKLRNLASEAES